MNPLYVLVDHPSNFALLRSGSFLGWLEVGWEGGREERGEIKTMAMAMMVVMIMVLMIGMAMIVS